WSGPPEHCDVPNSCPSPTIVTNVPVRVTVVNQSLQPEANVWIHAFTESGYTGLSYKTDISGTAYFTLSDGDYRFRADKLNRAYWSSAGYDCMIPSFCPDVTISVYNSVVVHVQDTSGNPDVGVEVRAFGPTNQIFTYTDSLGDATLQLPFGDYRFRAKKGLSLFWSGEFADCTVPACAIDTIITNVPITVTVLDPYDQPEEGLWVHAFLGTAYTGISFTTDSTGKTYFALNDGNYRFRADKGDRGYWSGDPNHCQIPTSCPPPIITTEGTGYAFAPDDWNSVFIGIPVVESAFTDRWRASYLRFI
ncbi:MAG: hypothetical protein JW748_07470, partial [Anaerolineales bacterium]|nr:hypothetical protein [Anaerolineales bacterium]